VMFECKEKLFLKLNWPVLGAETLFSNFPSRRLTENVHTKRRNLCHCPFVGAVPGRAIPRSRNVNWSIQLLIQSIHNKRKAKLGPLIETCLSVLIGFTAFFDR
jgi:hypothetical protein